MPEFYNCKLVELIVQNQSNIYGFHPIRNLEFIPPSSNQESAVVSQDFSNVFARHNGNRYLTPTDLEARPAKPRRVLIVGSCLAETWQDKIDCPNDFVLTNNINALPNAPPQPVENYDLQLIQIPLRFIVPDDSFWHVSHLDTDSHQRIFDESLERLDLYLAMAMRWNKEHAILTFVANFLIPQQNAMGRFAPRYNLTNPVYFIEQLNVHLSRKTASYKNAHILDIDAISSVMGKKYVQDDTAELQTHAALLGDSNYHKDQERIEPILPMTQHYKLHRDDFIFALWHQAAAMYKTLRQEDAVKLVIVDLDNTLWRGIIAEEEITDQTLEGWPLGLIEALMFLKKRGILLAIASRNEERRIKELWDQVMRGRLNLSDFSVIKINWRSKIENVEDILRITNILPRNTVFVDDNPVERTAIKSSFADIRVLGQHPYYLKRILLWAPETQTSNTTLESTRKTEMVQAQAARETARNLMSREEFLTSLKINIDFINVTSTSHPRFTRVLELLNKTNQFNTTGQRWTLEECEKKFEKDWDFAAFDIQDKFADYGLVGCALISGNTIEQFVMSCRVIGLDAEIKIITWLANLMLKNGRTEIHGRLIKTAHNFPCRDMYEKCGFTIDGELWTKQLV